jgi:hypothetical protein
MLDRLFTAIAFVGLCFGACSAYATSTEVKGLGAIVAGNIADARKNALEDAKRVAIEQMLGSYISARTETNNFMLASEKIYSTAKGHIDGYDLLEEGKLDSDTYFVKIKAHLNDRQAANTATQQLSKFNWYKQPSIAVKISESSGDYGVNTHAIFIAELVKSLKKIGFNVIDNTAQTSITPSFIISSSLSTNISSSEYQGIELKSNQISVATQMINAQTGQVLSTSTESKQAAGMNSLNLLKDMALQLALRVSQRVNLDTKILWLNDNTHSVLLSLEVKDAQQASLIESALSQAVVGLGTLQTQAKTSNKISYLTEYQGWSEQLFAQLSTLSLDPTIPFFVSSFNGSEITLSTKH